MSDRAKAFTALGIFTFMATLDGSIVNVGLPTMARELNTSLSRITWVVTLYLVVISGVILVYGRIGDLVSKTKVVKFGMIVFTIGSFLSGLEIGLGLPWLLFGRVIQALGAAAFMANGFGIVAEIFPPQTRARALAGTSMFVSAGSIAGPAIGGFILQITSWHYIFWINVPIGIIGYIFGYRALKPEHGKGSLSDVDIPGSLQMFGAIILIVLAVNFGEETGWVSLPVIGSFIVGAILLFTFIRTELKVKSPLLNLNIFKTKLFSMSIITAMLNFTAATFVSILLPFYLQDYRTISPGLTGLIMTAYPVGMLICSPIAGWLADFFDKELITFAGISGIIVAGVGYLFIGQGASYWYVVGCLLLHGCSVGFFQSPNNALIMSTVDKKYLGIAGAVNSLARNIAFVLGASLATTTLFIAMSEVAGQHITTYVRTMPFVFLDGMHIAFFVAVILVIITWVLGLARLIGNSRVKKTLATQQT